MGCRFNRLLILGLVDKGTSCTFVECLCDCGNIKTFALHHISGKYAETKSCGCFRKEFSKEILEKNRLKRKNLHGETKTHFWNKWNRMKDRCQRKVFPYDKVILNEEWLKYRRFKLDMFESYQEHLDEYGEKNTTLDRKDNSKGYSKDNCRWATYKTQVSNRTNSRWIEYEGELVYLPDICREVGIKLSTVASRIYRGWDPESAVKLPVNN